MATDDTIAAGSITAVIFDKDGTLVDVGTWDHVVNRTLDRFVPDPEQRRAAADALGFDLATGRLEPTAPLLYESNDWWIERVALHAGRSDDPGFPAEVEAAAARWAAGSVAPVPGAEELLRTLSGQGIGLAVVTNDDEASSRVQLESLGWLSLFTAVFGYDSGHGPKPRPGMVTAAVRRLGTTREAAVVVGDSATDLRAAKTAGVRSVLLDRQGDPSLHALADHRIARLADLPELLGLER